MKHLPHIVSVLVAAMFAPACGGTDSAPPPAGGRPFPMGDVELPFDELELDLNSLNESDIDAGFLDKDENIGNGSSGGWSDFVDEARTVCRGEPRGFAVQGGRLRFVQRDNVDSWEALFPRGVELVFRDTSGSDSSAVQAVAARVDSPTGVDPVELSGVASRADLAPLLDSLLGGDFHVAVRGYSGIAESESFSVDLGIALHVATYCE